MPPLFLPIQHRNDTLTSGYLDAQGPPNPPICFGPMSFTGDCQIEIKIFRATFLIFIHCSYTEDIPFQTASDFQQVFCIIVRVDSPPSALTF